MSDKPAKPQGIRAWLAPGFRRRVLLTALLCVVLSLLPLVGTLGYFGALALAPVFSLMGVSVGRDAGARALLMHRRPETQRRAGLFWALAELFALWLLAVATFSVAMASWAVKSACSGDTEM